MNRARPAALRVEGGDEQPRRNALAGHVGTLARGATVSLGGKLAGRGLQIATQLVLARVLGPVGFGLYAVGWTVLRVLEVITPLGLSNGVVHFGTALSSRNASSGVRAVAVSAVGLGMLSGAAGALGLYLAAPAVARGFFQSEALVPIFRGFAIALPLVAGMRIAAAATRIHGEMRISVLVEDLAQGGLNLALTIGVLAAGARVLGAVGATAASYAGAFCLAVLAVHRLYPHGISTTAEQGPSTRTLLTYSLPTAMAGALSTYLMWVDRLLIAHFLSPADVGVYQAISQPPLIFSILLAGLNMTVAPIISRCFHRGQLGELHEVYRVATKWGLYAGMPIALSLVILPDVNVEALYGSAYLTGTMPLVVLAVGQLVNLASGPVGFLHVMTGRQNRWLALSAVAFVANVVLNVVLLPRHGLMGAAVATSLALSALFVGGVVLIWADLRMLPYDWRYVKGAGAAACCTMFLLLLQRVDWPVHLLAGAALVGGAAIFTAVLVILPSDPEDGIMLHLVRSRAARSRSK